MKKVPIHVAYAAIRQTEGNYWIDLDSISGCWDEAQKKAERSNGQIPQWALDNPVVAYRQVEVRKIAGSGLAI